MDRGEARGERAWIEEVSSNQIGGESSGATCSGATCPAPLVHCINQGDRHRFKGAYKAFVDAFKAACDILAQSKWEREFPEGGLPPLWELKAAA